MAMFKKPKWLKPEINEAKYYIHILILSIVVLSILKFGFGHDMLTILWTLKLSLATIIADIVAHTSLQID